MKTQSEVVGKGKVSRKAWKRVVSWSISGVMSLVLVGAVFLYIFPKLPISAGPLAKMQAYAFSARKIMGLAIFREDTIVEGENAEAIVEEIVKRRVQEPYLFTGGHYTDFYPRNLGTFSNKLLDPIAADNAADWLDRVELILRSTEIALQVFSEYDEVTTTIVELENGKYVPINIYVASSDSLPSILRVLQQMRMIEEQSLRFGLTKEEEEKRRGVKQKTYELIEKYRDFLAKEVDRYVGEYVDEEGFIREDLKLSGIKDAWVRHSAFYDNVMLWSVYYYAWQTGIKPEWQVQAIGMKQRLIEAYWDEDAGIFYDEKKEYVKEQYFSADNLIAMEMGMLRAEDAEDRVYLQRIRDYIEEKNLAQPFPLKTTEIRIPEREHLPVRIFAPNYIGTTIWSYWGMLYIDLLIKLGEEEKARTYLDSYTNKIEEYGGFPELYFPDGRQYRLRFYRSVNDMVWGIYYLYMGNTLKI
jgi:hypothetical protein